MTASKLKFANWSKYVGDKHGVAYFEWCIFLDSAPETVESIQAIEYTLHPSFPDPIRLRMNKEARFSLMSGGWGGFSVGIVVRHADGLAEPCTFPLQLRRDDWPTKQASPEELGPIDGRVYKELFSEKFRWRKLSTVSRTAAVSVAEARAALERLHSKNLARAAEYKSIDGQELWGPTAVVGIEPRL